MKILKAAIYSCWVYGYELVDISLQKLTFVILSASAAQQLCLVSVEGWVLVSLHTLSHQGIMDNIPMYANFLKPRNNMKKSTDMLSAKACERIPVREIICNSVTDIDHYKSQQI